MMLALAEEFLALGVRCDVIIAMNKGRLLDDVPAGIRLINLRKRKPHKAIFALAHYLRREQPNTLLSTIFQANIAALIAGTVLTRHARVVIREAAREDLFIRDGSKLHAWLDAHAAALLYMRADAVIAVSQSVRASLLRLHGVNASRVTVIVNPVVPSNGTRDIDPDGVRKINVLACGRLEPVKDHASLLRAFALVRERFAAKLIIMGEGTLLNELQVQARYLGIGDDVTFAGFVRHPQQYMHNASVFVHTSRHEGLPNVLLEALAVGCPIVATDCLGGVREVLGNGTYGTLVPVGDHVAIANAIEQVLTGRVQFPDAGSYLDQFAIKRVAEQYLSILFPPDSKDTLSV